MNVKDTYQQVQEHYGAIARGAGSEKYGQAVAKALGYTDEELANIPQDANLGLSCGNPLALANLRQGETVIDLGSGAGFDVFLAAKRVGHSGQAIGVDMNRDMLAKANLNKANANATNISFIESGITKIALPEATADCIISNCVVNLVPELEKQFAFNEMFRLLKPGGRIAISDILIKKDLNSEMKRDMALYVGCISGASQVSQYETYLHEAGFEDIFIVDNRHDLNVYKSMNEDGVATGSSCCGENSNMGCYQKSASCCTMETSEENATESFMKKYNGINFNEWAGSFQVYAVKPQSK